MYVLVMWIGFLGLVDLPAGFVGPGRSHVIDGSYGALTFIVIPAGFLAHVRLPRERVAGVHQLWAAALALGVVGLLSTEYRYLALAAVIGLGSAVIVALYPERRNFLHPNLGFVPALAVLTVLGAAPWMWHASRMVSNARALLPPRDAETNGFHHWTAAGSLALCVIFLMVLASTKTPGWRLPALTAAVAGSVYGVSSILYPDDAGSAGTIWGISVLIWCLLVAVTALSGGRRGLRQQHNPSS